MSPASIFHLLLKMINMPAENNRMVTGSFKIACVLHTLNNNQQTRIHLG